MPVGGHFIRHPIEGLGETKGLATDQSMDNSMQHGRCDATKYKRALAQLTEWQQSGALSRNELASLVSALVSEIRAGGQSPASAQPSHMGMPRTVPVCTYHPLSPA